MAIYKNLGTISFVSETDHVEIFATPDHYILQFRRLACQQEELELFTDQYRGECRGMRVYAEEGKQPCVIMYREALLPVYFH